jgi:hypothetical protein
MSQSVEQLERTRLREIAREYEKNGYRVVVEPHGPDLPTFLADFRPDLIAFGKDETVVIEIESRATLTDSPSLVALTDAIAARPGWRFELVVTNSRNAAIAGDRAQRLDPQEIEDRLATAETVLNNDQVDSAFILVWSAVEASLHLLAERHEVDLRDISSAFLMKQLLTLGIIAREDYEALQDGLQLRNLLLQGFRVPNPERMLVVNLINRVRKFIRA